MSVFEDSNSLLSTSKPVDHLLDVWLTDSLREDSMLVNDVAKLDGLYTYLSDCRNHIWTLCEMIAVPSIEVASRASHIFEVYIQNSLKKEVLALTSLDGVNIESTTQVKFRFIDPLLLVLMSCIQISAKATSLKYFVSSTKVRDVLIKYGKTYSLSDIRTSEFNVFAALGFKIPVWTSVDLSELLAYNVGLHTVGSMRLVGWCTHVAELRKYTINRAINTRMGRRILLRRAQFCAAAVCLALPSTGQTSRVQYLAKTVRMLPSDLDKISKLIASMMVSHPTLDSRNLKINRRLMFWLKKRY